MLCHLYDAEIYNKISIYKDIQCYIKSQVHSTPKSTEILESAVKSILLKLKIKMTDLLEKIVPATGHPCKIVTLKTEE